jgi:hypothetical protein
LSSLNTVHIATTKENVAIHVDEVTYHADHIIVCNRVKPHSKFRGSIEGGLFKMLVVGLGNYNGARNIHRAIQDFGFEHVIRSVGQIIVSKCPILACLAIVENGYGEVALIEAIPPH